MGIKKLLSFHANATSLIILGTFYVKCIKSYLFLPLIVKKFAALDQ